MKKTILYSIWLCMAILCIGLGTLEIQSLALQISLAAIGIVFFVPPAILVYDALESRDRKEVIRLRLISIASLVLTVVSLIAFVLTAAVGAEIADLLYDLLNIVSCPMLCCQQWLISLFLWGCLLSATFFKTNQK